MFEASLFTCSLQAQDFYEAFVKCHSVLHMYMFLFEDFYSYAETYAAFSVLKRFLDCTRYSILD